MHAHVLYILEQNDCLTAAVFSKGDFQLGFPFTLELKRSRCFPLRENSWNLSDLKMLSIWNTLEYVCLISCVNYYYCI